MSEFLFGVLSVKPTTRQRRKLERIAHRHCITLIEAVLPGIGYQRWFAAPRTYGSPFDGELASVVAADIAAEVGQIGPRGRGRRATNPTNEGAPAVARSIAEEERRHLATRRSRRRRGRR